MLFKNQYRIESTRLKGWDYSSPGRYFITICTGDHECCFGSVRNGKMDLSDIGYIADKYLHEIPNHFPFAMVDEFIVMPNHVHVIIQIKNNPGNQRGGGFDGGRDAKYCVSTPVNIPKTQCNNKNTFGPQSGNLASIIRGYKTGVSVWCRKSNRQFVWQPRFYDHIIRDEKELYFIRRYIRQNPACWDKDEFVTQKIS